MILPIVAFLLFLPCVLLFKAVRVLPIYELRRRAQSGDGGIRSIYKAASYGTTLDIVLWTTAASFLSWSVVAAFEVGTWLAVGIVFSAGLATAFIKLPLQPSGPAWALAKLSAKPAAAVAGILHPLTSLIFKSSVSSSTKSTGVFEKQDLINLIKSQKNLDGNRISGKDLQVVEAALRFSNKTVNEAMATGAKLCFVSGSEPVGPLLMDELHSRGRFAYLVTKGPVKKQGSKPTGTLFLRDLVGHHKSGQVKDIAHEQVYYINEAQSIGDALQAMTKTQFPILAVVNNFEEIAGVISLEDIIKQLLPDSASSDSENWANPKVVAGWRKDKPGKNENLTVSSEKSGN